MRLELTVHDLTRVGLAGVDPLVELTASLRLLQSRDGTTAFAWWRRWARHHLPSSARALAWLCRPGVAMPACLVPFPGRPDLETALAAVRETSPERLHEDVLRAADGHGIPPWATSLADGHIGTLVTALRDYFEAALTPHWPTVRAQVEADLERRTQTLLTGGVYALLTSLRPLVTWSSPTTAADAGVEDVRLGGARLVLLPAFFSIAPEILTAYDGQPARLVYPSERNLSPARTNPGDQRKALADLLGPTRAAALRTMAAGCSTSELAALLGVTPSAVSKHTAILREAGLISTHRDRNTVLHSLTPLGSALLAN
jgi:DNA-binding transcriptional ArsR family regulator